jgi:hypothetical protein
MSPAIVLFVFSVALLLFPPFVYDGRGYARIYIGHHFIFNPPSQIAYIDFVRIAAYWLLGVLLCAAWYFATRAIKGRGA